MDALDVTLDTLFNAFLPVCDVPPIKNVRFTGESPLDREAVKQAITQAELCLGKGGRVLVRPSGTEPLIRVMAEGDDRAEVERVVDSIIKTIESGS